MCNDLDSWSESASSVEVSREMPPTKLPPPAVPQTGAIVYEAPVHLRIYNRYEIQSGEIGAKISDQPWSDMSE